jgi:hypothetical protein
MLQTAELGFLRVVIELERRSKIKIYDVRNKIHMESLNDTVNKCKENCKNHVQGMNENRKFPNKW